MLPVMIIVLTASILGLSMGFRGSCKTLRSRSSSLLMVIPVRGGSVVALVTPMTENNAIDYPRLESLLKWHMAEGKAILCIQNYFYRRWWRQFLLLS